MGSRSDALQVSTPSLACTPADGVISTVPIVRLFGTHLGPTNHEEIHYFVNLLCFVYLVFDDSRIGDICESILVKTSPFFVSIGEFRDFVKGTSSLRDYGYRGPNINHINKPVKRMKVQTSDERIMDRPVPGRERPLIIMDRHVGNRTNRFVARASSSGNCATTIVDGSTMNCIRLAMAFMYAVLLVQGGKPESTQSRRLAHNTFTRQFNFGQSVVLNAMSVLTCELNEFKTETTTRASFICNAAITSLDRLSTIQCFSVLAVSSLDVLCRYFRTSFLLTNFAPLLRIHQLRQDRIPALVYSSSSDIIYLTDFLGERIQLPIQFFSSAEILHQLLLYLFQSRPEVSIIRSRSYEIRNAQSIVIAPSMWECEIQRGAELEMNAVLVRPPWISTAICPFRCSLNGEQHPRHQESRWSRCSGCSAQFYISNIQISDPQHNDYFTKSSFLKSRLKSDTRSDEDSYSEFEILKPPPQSCLGKRSRQLDWESQNDQDELEENTADDREISAELRQCRKIHILQFIDDEEEGLLDYMCQISNNAIPDPKYMDKQTETSWEMRRQLIDWLISLQLHCRLSNDALLLAINIVDRFLTKEILGPRKSLRLVGISALFIAAKYEEPLRISARDFVNVTDYEFHWTQITETELEILLALDFNVSSYSSPDNWIQRISRADNYNMRTQSLSKFLVEYALHDQRFLPFTPDLFAAIVMYTARKLIGGDWDDAFIYYSGYTETQLSSGHQLLLNTLKENKLSHYEVCRKYSQFAGWAIRRVILWDVQNVA